MTDLKLITLTLLLIPLFLLGACEQQSAPSQTTQSRTVYKENIHDKEFGNYIIHINALTTDQLPTEVARAYKISRSKSRAMLNVSIMEKQNDAMIPVTTSIKVVAKNLSNQQKNVEVREIKETDPLAIYYIGELAVSNEETIKFEIDVIPVGATEPILISYSQQFFVQ